VQQTKTVVTGTVKTSIMGQRQGSSSIDIAATDAKKRLTKKRASGKNHPEKLPGKYAKK
jgi:hypothetical protein